MKPLRGNHKLVMEVFVASYLKRGYGPTAAEIISKTNLNRNAVEAALRQLEGKGFLKRTKQNSWISALILALPNGSKVAMKLNVEIVEISTLGGSSNG